MGKVTGVGRTRTGDIQAETHDDDRLIHAGSVRRLFAVARLFIILGFDATQNFIVITTNLSAPYALEAVKRTNFKAFMLQKCSAKEN